MASRGKRSDLSPVFKALGSPHRLAVVRALIERDLACCTGDRATDCSLDSASCNVGDLAESLAINGATLSHHLKELDRAGLIERQRSGRQIFCRINRRRLEELWRFLVPDGGGALVTIGRSGGARRSPAA